MIDQVDKKGSAKASKRPGSVLYLCNHNIIRSPMAEAITRAHFGNSVYTASAGVSTGTPDPFVEVVLKEININLNNRQPQSLADMDEGYFDLVVTLSPTAHQVAMETPQFASTEVAFWFSADPTVTQGSREQMLDAYRDVRDRLQDNILSRFDIDLPA